MSKRKKNNPPKQLRIGVKAMRSLNASINKWKRVVKNVKAGKPYVEQGCEDCSLCLRYAQSDDSSCAPNCPVAADGHGGCWGTPYGDWYRAEEDGRQHDMEVHSQEMLDYLEDLKSRCTVVPMKNQHG